MTHTTGERGVRSYLLSWLVGKYASLPLDAFVAAQPSEWLVWEAGPWRPPARTGETVVAGATAAAAASGESLAIALSPRDGSVSIGRGATNDVVIDDATLSRVHLVLRRDAAGFWRAQDAGSSNGTRVNGQPIGETPIPLETGAGLEAGAVRLTFYDAKGLWLRLRLR